MVLLFFVKFVCFPVVAGNTCDETLLFYWKETVYF